MPTITSQHNADRDFSQELFLFSKTAYLCCTEHPGVWGFALTYTIWRRQKRTRCQIFSKQCCIDHNFYHLLEEWLLTKLTQYISIYNQFICVDMQIGWLDISVSKNDRLLPTSENLNSTHVSSLCHPIVQPQGKRLFPEKSHPAPLRAGVKLVTPWILMMLFFHYMTTWEQNLPLCDLSVSLRIDRATLTVCQTWNWFFNIVLKAYEVVHNFISCLLNWIAESKLLISFSSDLLTIQKMQAKSLCNTCYKFLYTRHKMHCWSRLWKLNEHTCFSLKISIPDNFILTGNYHFVS